MTEDVRLSSTIGVLQLLEHQPACSTCASRGCVLHSCVQHPARTTAKTSLSQMNQKQTSNPPAQTSSPTPTTPATGQNKAAPSPPPGPSRPPPPASPSPAPSAAPPAAS